MKTGAIPGFDIESLLQSEQNIAFQVGFPAATFAEISQLFISKQIFRCCGIL